MTLLRGDGDGSHWYRHDGTPCYEVPMKSNPKKMKTPTLREARTIGLVPSVTGIINMMAKPGLERWKQEQLLLACYANPPFLEDLIAPESVEAYARRIDKIAKEISSKAADLGTEVHGTIKKLLIWELDENVPVTAGPYKFEQTEEIRGFFEGWYPDEIMMVHHLEEPFASPLGFGGTLDIDYESIAGGDVLGDFKTQRTKPDKPIAAYDAWGMQLVAYAKGTNRWEHRLKNIVLSTTEPGRIEVVDWTDRKDEMWDMFLACLTLWKGSKKFDPSWKEES